MKDLRFPKDSEGTLYEDLVLAVILLWPRVMAQVSEYLRPEHFSKKQNQDYFFDLLENYKRGNGELDLVNFLEKFGDKNQELADMVAGTSYVVVPAMALNYVKRVVEAKQYRDLINIGEEVQKDATKQKGTIQEITSYYSSLLSAIDEEIHNGHSVEEISKILSGEIEKHLTGETVRMQTGIRELDGITGGIWPSVVMRICAYANTGKSTFLYYLTKNLLAAGYRGLFFSTEVQASRVLAMLMASRLDQRYNEIYQGKVALTGSIKDFDNLKIYDNKRDIEEIYMESVKHQPQFIVIDYLQELNHKIPDEYSRMSHVAAQIRKLSIQQNVAVIDASQVPNDWQNKRGIFPTKGSGDLASSCDIGLLLSMEDGVMTVDVRKNKFGIKKSFCLVPDFERVSFSESAKKFNPYQI